MRIERNILSKENSLVLRGMAIMAIMLHNFLHNPKLGFSLENEMSFSEERARHFFTQLSYGTFNLYDWLSFLGWTGVVVFVFLTGYGIAKNTPPLYQCKILYHILYDDISSYLPYYFLHA